MVVGYNQAVEPTLSSIVHGSTLRLNVYRQPKIEAVKQLKGLGVNAKGKLKRELERLLVKYTTVGRAENKS